MINRKEQKEKRRIQILNVALDLFIRKGYAATKISDIAQAADMSVGLLFHYFPSKEHLYSELIKIGVAGPKSVMEPLMKLPPLLFFEQACEQILQAIQQNSFTAKMFVLMQHTFYSEAAPANIRQMMGNMNYYEMTVPLIIAGQKDGTIRAGDPLALSIAFWVAIQGVGEVIARNDSMPCPQSEWIIDIIRRKS